MPTAIKLTNSGTDAFLLALKVIPGARRERIVGPLGDALKIAVAQPPEDGRANEAVVKLLATALGVPRHAVTLVGGFTSGQKLVRITGLTREELAARLDRLLPL